MEREPITEVNLKKYRFESTNSGMQLLIKNGDAIWYYDKIIYIAPSDAPNENYCVPTSIKYIDQIPEIYKLLTGEDIIPIDAKETEHEKH